MTRVFYLVFIILLLLSINSYAQVLDNKTDLHFSYIRGTFSGHDFINENGFIFPALFANYNNYNGFSFRNSTKLNKFISAGVNISYNKASGWKLETYDYYDKSKVRQLYIAPSISFHSPYAKLGLFNKFCIFGSIEPGIGISNLILDAPLINVPNSTANIPVEETSPYFGITLNLGIKLIINNRFGFFYAYSYQWNYINGTFYNEKSFSLTHSELGIFIRVRKNKSFY